MHRWQFPSHRASSGPPTVGTRSLLVPIFHQRAFALRNHLEHFSRSWPSSASPENQFGGLQTYLKTSSGLRRRRALTTSSSIFNGKGQRVTSKCCPNGSIAARKNAGGSKLRRFLCENRIPISPSGKLSPSGHAWCSPTPLHTTSRSSMIPTLNFTIAVLGVSKSSI